MEPAMLTRMSDEKWDLVVEIFRQVCPRRGEKAHDDRRFLRALHYFAVHNVAWRSLPAKFGNWNTVWKRFSRLAGSGTFFGPPVARLSGYPFRPSSLAAR
jgi:transposase